MVVGEGLKDRQVTAIIEARMGSTRLPGKTLMSVVGKPLLQLLIERLKWARWLDAIVVATTQEAIDDDIERLTRRWGVGCFRGSSDDVLGRVLGAARSAKADIIVEITGDSPLVDPEIVDQVVSVYLQGDYDYVSNVVKRTFPRGLDVQVFSTTLLGEVAQLTSDPVDREHVSLYIYEHPERFRLYNVESGSELYVPELRLTVDTIEDLRLVEAVFQHLYVEGQVFRTVEVLDLLQRRPELLHLNRAVEQKRVR